MAGLWPLQAGEISMPEKSRIFYLSQRPYLVAGTLRDQLLYPFPPAAVWDATSPAAQVWGRGGKAAPCVAPLKWPFNNGSATQLTIACVQTPTIIEGALRTPTFGPGASPFESLRTTHNEAHRNSMALAATATHRNPTLILTTGAVHCHNRLDPAPHHA
jgi:hypothetical protein